MDTITTTLPVPATTPIIDALDRSARNLQALATQQRIELTGRPTWTITVRAGVPHLTIEQPVDPLLHPECGSETGYTYHRRKYGTPTCEPCKQAHATAERRRKQRRLEGVDAV